ncbi:MAG: DUF5668 domain-containing protein [Coriobacteriia bacterium]|nr:DUF5668 domain-containing protein [Coriobacteriia bacterium]
MSSDQNATMTPTPPPSPPYIGASAGGGRPRPGRGGGAVWFGVILLVVGALMLLRQLVPGFGLSGAWPVGIVAIVVMVLGVRQMVTPGDVGEYRPNRVIEGLTTIAIGVILLAQSVGAVRWDVWLSVLSLWPLLLIAAGIDLIGKGTGAGLLRVLSSVVILGGLLYGAFVLPGISTSWTGWGFRSGSAEEFSFSQPAARIDSGTARIKGAVGELTVGAGAELATASGVTPFGQPEFRVGTSGRSADVRISMGDDGPVFWPGGEARMDVTLSRDVVWDLVLDTGVSRLDADLSELSLSRLSLEAGVTDARITLGSDIDDEVRVLIEAGVSSVTVLIPSGTEARVVAETGLSTVHTDVVFAKDGNVRQTDGYDAARDRYLIEIKSGVTNVRVETY